MEERLGLSPLFAPVYAHTEVAALGPRSGLSSGRDNDPLSADGAIPTGAVGAALAVAAALAPRTGTTLMPLIIGTTLAARTNGLLRD